MVFMPFPDHRVHALRVSGCGGVSSHFSLSLLVRPFTSLEALLRRTSHYLEPILLSAASPASLRMPLANFFYLGTSRSLACPHRLTLIEVS